MKHLMLSAAAIVVAFGLGACERETSTVEKGGTTVVQPTTKEKETVVLPTPGPAGPAGPAGAAGAPGSDTGSVSSETKKETTTETSRETKKE